MQNAPTSADCYNCRFFKPTGDRTLLGECRRFPPVHIPGMFPVCGDVEDIDEDIRQQNKIARDWSWNFPVVHCEGDSWCGEFQQHPKAEKDVLWRDGSA